eukprot:CAMPEP_0197832892 /NCGR_PEP_ID=MMETSP1437-20131217/16697_1 /TAXON_ID=49252 ORGANISM="Eucampia antarctica, Strain CCMP1452" /NCGR_SAMPLE_ID=MMETSP1437 /ASSEMBLY_ACC=CAM_ASM_001096 /LENGTH=972 /DNA_ID=CAMNT_0043436529 /DNA_START=189 /DNA_END=3107 /DNA_ORIENTATION=+
MSGEEGNKSELEWPMDRVRQTFIDYFAKKYDHTVWPSSPCVPHDDPTLLFANAGMNQYKPLFLGTCDPNVPMSGLKRAVNSQKCIRAGGKHNDLDDVGKDVYHHTFFEMLGNWSFGDYFKKEAIEMAWKCLTEEFGIDPERLYASYFAGDESSPCDEESRAIWLQFLPENRVLPFGKEDNFWEMGATGPCGPCIEIHYDRIGNRDASKLVNADLPDVIEIWNNVFIQFNREADGSIRPLPARHIDTGMGFERLVSILQGVSSNYDTDIFQPLFVAIQQATGCSESYSGKIGTEDGPLFRDMAYRVIADHIRTLCFAIADGAVPSNDGRGYVLRRVLRRAVRYGRQNLNAKQLGFFSTLVPTVVELYKNSFPELGEKQEMVTAIIAEEEASFSRTLDKGLLKFSDMADKVPKGQPFSGADAHFLYSSMGFPVDLTELMAEERGLALDRKGFEDKMQHEKDLSIKAHEEKLKAGSDGKDMRLVAEQTAYLVNSLHLENTDDSFKYQWDVPLNDCKVKALFIGRGETPDGMGFLDTVSTESGTVGIILDKTAFYAEAGGQIYDTGVIQSENASMTVNAVLAYGQFVLHLGALTHGSFQVGDSLSCQVDYQRRNPIASNHTMTHVLNFALKHVLEDSHANATIDQKGSSVDSSRLRFDFSFPKPLSTEELRKVQDVTNSFIEREVPVDSYVASLDQAQQISSLRAVFGEVYPDPVRVVAISTAPVTDMLNNPQNAAWNADSVEFCGGTHLQNSKQAQRFILLQEEGIAKGIRRITGLTQKDANTAYELGQDLIAKVDASSALPDDSNELESQVKLFLEAVNTAAISAVTKAELRLKLESCAKRVIANKKKQEKQKTQKIVAQVLEAAKQSKDNNKIVLQIDFGIDGKVAKAVQAAYGKDAISSQVACLLITSCQQQNKFMVVAFTGKKNKSVDCKAWATAAIQGTNGKGGGKKDSAQFQVMDLKLIGSVKDKANSF